MVPADDLGDRASGEVLRDDLDEAAERAGSGPVARVDDDTVVLGNEGVEVRAVGVVRDGEVEVRVAV